MRKIKRAVAGTRQSLKNEEWIKKKEKRKKEKKKGWWIQCFFSPNEADMIRVDTRSFEYRMF